MLAALSFDRYKIAQTLQGRGCILCFETVLGMKKNKVNLEMYSESVKKGLSQFTKKLYFKTQKYGGTKLLHMYTRDQKSLYTIKIVISRNLKSRN